MESYISGSLPVIEGSTGIEIVADIWAILNAYPPSENWMQSENGRCLVGSAIEEEKEGRFPWEIRERWTLTKLLSGSMSTF